MATEAWMNGPLDGYEPVVMPAAHALVQAIEDLEKATDGLSDEEILERPNGAPSIAFHLRHIAGSIDRLLTYSRGIALNAEQFERLKAEETAGSESSAGELTQRAVDEITKALEELKTFETESLFEERFVGRQKLPTNVYGLLFHIAEHTARHVGQVVTTAKIVKNVR